MFFWGGYSFNLPQQQEHPDRPPLKFPLYVPPPPSYLLQQQTDKQKTDVAGRAGGKAEEHTAQLNSKEDGILALILQNRLRVRAAACGLKHAVFILEGDGGAGIYGLGSNHHGQLGHRVATYTNTLVDLNHSTTAAQAGGTSAAEGASFFSGEIVSVACGLRHTLLCTSSGCVYASGDNTYGQLGLDASTLSSYAKARGGRHGPGDGVGDRKGAGAEGAAVTGNKAGGGGSSVAYFTQVRSLVHIKKVYASHNASFAIDDRGNVFSWGDAQYGHLGHGGDHIVADERGGLDRVENVKVPRMIRWFERHRVAVGEVAVGKGHVLFMSRDGEDVYTCGEGYFGKLGHGSIENEFDPRRLESFPERKQKEKVVAIAAGDDCSLVLKKNPVIGSVVYFFGKLTNGDGQLKPFIIPFPYTNLPLTASPAFSASHGVSCTEDSRLSAPAESSLTEGGGAITLTSVQCGRGNQCMALSADGRLFVWGKHAYARLANGTDADASRARPTVVASLEKYVVTGAATGGTLMVAWASALREPDNGNGMKPEEQEETAAPLPKISKPEGDLSGIKEEEEGMPPAATPVEDGRVVPGHAWDVVVPHDARINTKSHMSNPDGDVEGLYEEGVRTFLSQFFGPAYANVASRYVAGMPRAPPRTERHAYQFERIAVKDLTVGQKVRLWMSNLYALGTVVKLDADAHDDLAAAAATPSATPSQPRGRSVSHSQLTPVRNHSCSQQRPQSSVCGAAERSVASQTTLPHEHSEEEEEGKLGADAHVGRRVLITWERDDWRDEVVTLYSDDETMGEENDNRWQPFWFEKGENGEYVIAKSR